MTRGILTPLTISRCSGPLNGTCSTRHALRLHTNTMLDRLRFVLLKLRGERELMLKAALYHATLLPKPVHLLALEDRALARANVLREGEGPVSDAEIARRFTAEIDPDLFLRVHSSTPIALDFQLTGLLFEQVQSAYAVGERDT